MIELISLSGGTFLQGRDNQDSNHQNETPAHWVEVEPFAIGKFPVTQWQWREISKLPVHVIDLVSCPSYHSGSNYPVECINFDEALEFCNRLSIYTGDVYRLPTESEWEYACRAGTSSLYNTGESLSQYEANFDNHHTTRVEAFSPNDFGIHDMHGNIWEWCDSNYTPDYHKGHKTNDCKKVVRGGSFLLGSKDCTSTRRNWSERTYQCRTLGFRVVKEL